MNINQQYISERNSYSGQIPRYIVIHNTDNYSTDADARAHAMAQYHGNFDGYSAHVYVDDKSAYQAMPYSRGAWHVGVNYGGRLFGTVNNRNSVGIEMCVQAGFDYDKAFANGLDPAGIQEMRSLIASMPQTTGATVLISSHLLGEIEQMVDQVGILNHGRLLFEGSLQQLQKHSRGGILLRVLDAPKAAAVLQQQGVKAAVPADQPDTLQLPPLPDEALAALVCTLAESGVGVVGLTTQTKSLEDIFLSLTQTSGEVA